MAKKKTHVPDKAQTNTGNIVDLLLKNKKMQSTLSKYLLCLPTIQSRLVGIYSVESGEEVHSLKEHNVEVVGLAIKEKNVLYSCDASGEVIEWDINNGDLGEN
uniref:Uncharacterized protein n=1 Tax=Daphnia galeata TaxID=27404 RepID=A0A8J2WHI7_9CRUS|nr:unnamed protein product [Daphnia galeata]